MADLKNQRVAILMTDGFEQVEFTEPKKALDEAGATTKVVSLKSGKVRGWKKTEWGDSFPVDLTVDDADSTEFDALLLPGGVLNPDQLRKNDEAVAFVRAFFDEGKPVCAICHGPQILINAEVVEGRTLTSYPSVRKDLENAGAKWVDREVVVDQGLVTSRNPDDIPAFNLKMIEEIVEGVHAGQSA